jgi:membrane protein required for colicin V production
MNIIDIILGVILLYGLIRGFFRGFFAELASLIGFILGIYIAIYFSHYISDYLVDMVSWDLRFVNLASFAITFILVVFLISLAGKFLTKVASFAALGVLNKIIGAGFGFIKVAFVVSVVIMFFGSTNENIHIVEQKTLKESTLYAPIKTIAPLLVPAILREAKELDLIKEKESEA